MNQPTLDFSRPAFPPQLTPQSQRLLARLMIAPITNAEMRDDLRLLSYTRRLYEVKRAVGPDRTIIKKHIGNGIFEYRLVNNELCEN